MACQCSQEAIKTDYERTVESDAGLFPATSYLPILDAEEAQSVGEDRLHCLHPVPEPWTTSNLGREFIVHSGPNTEICQRWPSGKVGSTSLEEQHQQEKTLSPLSAQKVQAAQ